MNKEEDKNNKTNKIISKTKITKEESYNRSIIACGNYYYPKSMNYLKKYKSCMEAGYNEDYSKQESNKILGLDRIQDNLTPIWHNLENDLLLCQNMLHNWLNKHKNSAETEHIKELPKFIRLIGDSVGKFVKKEMKIEAKIEEKHIYLHFDDPGKELSYHKDIIDLHSERIKELKEVKKNGEGKS